MAAGVRKAGPRVQFKESPRVNEQPRSPKRDVHFGKVSYVKK